MSDFQTVEYEPFSLDPGDGEPPERRTIRPWRWLVVGLVIGLFAGFASTVELPETEVDLEPDPLAEEPAAVETEPIPTIDALDEAPGGFVGTVHVLVETTDAAAHGILFPGQPDVVTVDGRVDPTVRPDLGGNSLAEVVTHRDGTSVQVTTVYGARTTTEWFGEDVTSWAWSRTNQRDLAWTEPGSFDTTSFHRQVISGPPVEPVELDGAWSLVGYAESKAIAVSGDLIALVDLTGDQTYTRVGEPPIRMTGLWGDLVLAAGGGDTEVLVDLDGTYSAAPEWWSPAASLVLSDPGTGWGAQIVGDTLAAIDPEGQARYLTVTGVPAWSTDGRHLLVPQGSALLVLEVETGDMAWIDLGAPILQTWVT